MNDSYGGQVLFLGLVGLFIALIIVVNAKVAQKRKDIYVQLGNELGLRYVVPEPEGCVPVGGRWFDSMSDTLGIPSQLEVWPFQEGHSRRVGNAVRGNYRGRDLAVFDYSYLIRHGKTSTTYRFTIVATQLPLMAPDLVIGPESVGTRVGKFFGIRDIEFESNEFNQRFYVKCPDRKFAFDVINLQMMEMLLSIPIAHWTMSGPFLILVRDGWVGLTEMEALVQTQNRFIEALPKFIMLR